MAELMIAIAAWCSIPAYGGGSFYLLRSTNDVQQCRERLTACVFKDWPNKALSQQYPECFKNEKLK